MTPLQTYFPIGVVLLVALLLAVVMLALAGLLGPRRPSAVKDAPFECGSVPVGSARERFGVKFYVVAILFIVFDIEAIFLYPWAVLLLPSEGYAGLGWPGFVSMGIFVATLVAGLVVRLEEGRPRLERVGGSMASELDRLPVIATRRDEAQGFLQGLVSKGARLGRKYSIFQYPFVTACCGMEYMAVVHGRATTSTGSAPRFPRFSPRQADLLMVVGTINCKQAPVLRRIYEQMAEPKWVIAFGVCASSGGFYDNYATVQGIDRDHPGGRLHPGLPAAAGAGPRRRSCCCSRRSRTSRTSSSTGSRCPCSGRGAATASEDDMSKAVIDALVERFPDAVYDAYVGVGGDDCAFVEEGADRRGLPVPARTRRRFDLAPYITAVDYLGQEPALRGRLQPLSTKTNARVRLRVKVAEGEDASCRRVTRRVARRRLVRALLLRHVRDPVHRPPGPAAAVHVRRVRGAPAAQGLPAERPAAARRRSARSTTSSAGRGPRRATSGAEARQRRCAKGRGSHERTRKSTPSRPHAPASAAAAAGERARRAAARQADGDQPRPVAPRHARRDEGGRRARGRDHHATASSRSASCTAGSRRAART